MVFSAPLGHVESAAWSFKIPHHADRADPTSPGNGYAPPLDRPQKADPIMDPGTHLDHKPKVEILAYNLQNTGLRP